MVLLIAGFVLAKPFLIMWSIVVSVLSALFLVIGAFLRRNELFPGGGQAAAPATPPKGLTPPGMPYTQTGAMAHQPPPHTRPHPRPQPRAPQRVATVPAASAPRRPAAAGISPDAIVLVIPGRKRYHVPGCRQLSGRTNEELTYEEAREEGFTPCTTCLPDAALGGRQLPPAADPEPAVAPGSAISAESRAENSAETRDLRSPVAPPKPDTKASTPSPEPAAAHEEGAGWFGHSASAAPDSDDEQAETQTSVFRPHTLRAETPPSSAPPEPSTGKPSPGKASPGKPGTRPGTPAKTSGPSAPAKRSGSSAPAKRSGSSGRPAPGTSSAQSARTPEQPGAGPGQPSGASERPAGKPGQAAEKPAQSPGRPGTPAEEQESSADSPARTPAKPGRSAASPQQSGGKPGRSGGDGKRPQGATGGAADDDSAGPATAPQPRVPSSATPGRPGASGPSKTPSGDADTSAAVGQTLILPERPASSAESEAKPKGPLPAGATARSAAEGRPSGPPAKPGTAPKAGTPAAAGSPSGAGQKNATSRPGTQGAAAASEPSNDGTGTPKGGSPVARPQPSGTGAQPAGKPQQRQGDQGPGKPRQGQSAQDTGRPRQGQSDREQGKPRQGSQPSGGTPAKAPAAGSKAPAADSTAEGSERKPGDEPKGGDSRTVKVIVGTRRYHSTNCPLIRGAGESGVETMAADAAEAAGLTSCSVCQHDRESVS
ncbi:hypothetical protein [Nonomuraea sp. B1E8]|uniref:hypothetical protein n=1 Tax=unclassified Nonomuraea TaxID=2593643 RepID=UPI00325E750E